MVGSDSETCEYTLQEDQEVAMPQTCKVFALRVGVVISLMYAGVKVVSVTWLADVQGNVLMESAASNVSDSRCELLPIPSDQCLPAVATGAAFGFITGPIMVPVFLIALCCCGFGPAGVMAGSCAAACQTPFTIAGSCFACLQSCGAVGCWANVWPVALALACLGLIIAASVSGYCAACTLPEWHASMPQFMNISLPHS